MLNALSDTDLWIKIATVLTAAFGFMTAVVTFRKTRTPVADPPAATAPRLRLLSLEGDPKPRSQFWLKALVIVAGMMTLWMAALSVLTVISRPSLLATLPLLFFAAMTALLVVGAVRLWGDPQRGSFAKREVTLNFQASKDQVCDECIAALKRMKVKIETIDARKGLIGGATGLNFRSWGEILLVEITATGPDECTVHMKSDSKAVTTMLDYGKNASNVRRFIQELVR